MVKSTRSNKSVPISQAILDGLAKDGGLYIFETIPTIDLQSLKNATYIDVANVVFGLFLDDFDSEKLQSIIEDTYTTPWFYPSPMTMTHTKDYSYLNLFHGQTHAFKDMALSILPKLIQEAKQIQNINQPSIVLTATSGDTGSAALSGFRKNKEDYVLVLYPTNGVSPFQEKQVHQLQNDHCRAIAIDGNFDDCQSIVKELFQTVSLTNTQLVSANSINIGRLIPQITYYVYAYIQLMNDRVVQENELVDVVVPTGNFGNIYAAYIAKRMGIPFDRLTIASNANNVLHDFFKTGTYNIQRPLYQTISPSMDILISSNLERYLYTLIGEDSTALRHVMNELISTGSIHLDVQNQTDFHSGMATESETKQSILTSLQTDGILIDPHTAVAKHVYQKCPTTNHTIIVATASPFKFVDAMLDALQLPHQTLITDLQELARRAKIRLPKDIQDVAMVEITDKQTLSKHEAYAILRKRIGDIDEG